MVGHEKTPFSFSHIFWINASSEAAIIHGLKQISKTMHVGSPTSVKTTLNWISGLMGNWILVFDNADINHQIIEDFIPLGDTGYILITSRDETFGQTTICKNSLQVNEMEEEEAIYLLTRCGNLKFASREPVKEVVWALSFHPLAIDQVGAFMQACKCTASDYLGLYMKYKQEISPGSSFHIKTEYGLPAYYTWEIAMKQIEFMATNSASLIAAAAQSAIIHYKFFAILHNENIPEVFRRAAKPANKFKEVHTNGSKNGLHVLMFHIEPEDLNVGQDGEWNELEFKAGPQTLLSFSFIKEEYNELNTVHPLMHMWSRNRLSKIEAEGYSLKVRALTTFSAKTYNCLFCNMLVLHIIACYAHVQEGEYFDDESSSIAHVLGGAGEYGMAEKYALLSLQKRAKLLGSVHLDTLSAKCNLALVYQNKGMWDEAENLQLEVLREREISLGSDHPDTLTSMLCIAMIYNKQGKFSDAQKLQMQVVEVQKAKHGLNRMDTVMAIAKLASIYQIIGRWADAAILQNKVVEARRVNEGDREDHQDILVSMSNLAGTYHLHGKFEEALEQLVIHVTRVADNLFGRNSHMSLVFKSNLGSTWNKLQKLDDAEELGSQLLEDSEAKYGMNHSYTFVLLCHLAETFLMLNKLEKAEELAVQAMEIENRIFGSNQTEVHCPMSILGLVYHEQGKLDEAEKLQTSIAETCKQSETGGGMVQTDSLINMNNLALKYQKVGRREEAERLQLQAVNASKLNLGPYHPDTLTMMENLLMMCWQQRKVMQSKYIVIHIMKAKMVKWGPEHPESLWAIFNLGIIYQELGNLYHAEKLVAHALKGMKRRQGVEHPDTQKMVKARIKLLVQLFMVDVIDLIRTICQSESFQVFVLQSIVTWLFA